MTDVHTVKWAGFTWTDRPPWRLISCNACGKSHHLMHASDESTETLIRSHRCGPIGTPWTVPQSATSAPHAFLLASMAQEVYRQPHGSYAFPEVTEAALELIAAIASQLPAGLVYIEWPTEDLDAGLAGATLDDLQQLYDQAAAAHAADRAPAEPAPAVDPYATTERDDAEAAQLAAWQADQAHLEQAVGPVSARAIEGLGAETVSTASLVDLGRQVPVAVALADVVALLGPAGRRVIGVAWPQWEQCAFHLAEDVRSGRLAAVHDPTTVGRFILDGDRLPACSGCAVPPTAETPAVAP